ncbi:MAG: hypothetical protein WC951_13985, partial [Bacteroidales bacterium]
RTFRVVFVMAYRSTVNYFLSETINRIRHPLFPSYTTNDYSSAIVKLRIVCSIKINQADN